MVTLALRAHRLLCRLGWHLYGRWHVRKKKSGEYRVCASCKRDRWRPDKAASLGGLSFEELNLGRRGSTRFPVDKLGFPVIDHTPRDGVTHE